MGGITSSTGFNIAGETGNTLWMMMVMETSEHIHLVGGTTRTYLNTPVGTINYATGLTLNSINITGSTETAGITSYNYTKFK